jgi:hypothetical protein
MTNLEGGKLMSGAKFVPVEILKPTAEDQQNAKAHSEDSKVFDVFFRLSAQPTQEWAGIFSEVWEQRMRTAPDHLRAMAWIRGRQIGITSELDHLSELFRHMQSDVATTNQKYQAKLDEKANAEAEAKRKKEEAKLAQEKALSDAFKNLIDS